jgi:hypothetical protein
MIVVAVTRLDGITIADVVVSVVVRVMANMHTVLAMTLKAIANVSPGRMSGIEQDSD